MKFRQFNNFTSNVVILVMQITGNVPGGIGLGIVRVLLLFNYVKYDIKMVFSHGTVRKL